MVATSGGLSPKLRNIEDMAGVMGGERLGTLFFLKNTERGHSMVPATRKMRTWYFEWG